MDEVTWLTERPPARFRGAGLTMERFAAVHAEDLFAAVVRSLPELQPWMAWAAGYERSSADWFLAHSAEAWSARSELNYAVLDGDGELVGACGLIARIGVGGLEIGYWVRSDRTGRGIATRAAALLTVEAAYLPGVDHIEIHHDRDNTRSGRVPAALGYERVGTRQREPEAPGESGELVMWRIAAADVPDSPAAALVAVGS